MKSSSYYTAAQDWAGAAEYLADQAEMDMTNYAVVLDLARARMLNGDKAGALPMVRYLREKSPGTLQMDPALVQLDSR